MAASSWVDSVKKKEIGTENGRLEKQKTAGLFSFGGRQGVGALGGCALTSHPPGTENQKDQK
ncbi:hypothetical protein [Paracidovorax konjaci]|uniref:hypothetical protein n=1 Tax=Paracidovorax konjaci TaxID=32040 RepID=UPI001113FF0B|nr:hypothetical protein [Paracidovorax konjaci]